MEAHAARERVVEAAEPMFCSRGIAAVRMEEVRDASGVALRQLYQLFPSKEDLAIACMHARDVTLHDSLVAFLGDETDPTARLLGVFDFMDVWFRDEDFTGCAWINAFGQFGYSSPRIAAEVRASKAAFHGMLTDLCVRGGLPSRTADALMVVAQGAIVCAAVQREPDFAAHARRAAQTIVEAASAHTAGL